MICKGLDCLHASIAIVFTHLNGLNYCYLTRMILFDVYRSLARSKMITIIAI